MIRVPDVAISRLITYLRVLDALDLKGTGRTSSDELAELTQVTAVQIRKDLSYFGSYGTRGVGYAVQSLRREIRQILGLNRRWGVALVGMGRLGQAIADYTGFGETYELRGLFDHSPSKIGNTYVDLLVQPLDQLKASVEHHHIDLGMITVPATEAQKVADALIDAGVKGILNFAPAVLEAPNHVFIENVDFLAGLSRLSFFTLNK